MKAIIVFLALCATVTANAQNIAVSKVPLAARLAAQKSHAAVKKISWEQDGENYEAGFTDQGKETSEIYSAKGILLEKEVEIKVDELPTPVADYVRSHYKNQQVKEATRITKSNGEINYEAQVNRKDLIFDSTGKLIK